MSLENQKNALIKHFLHQGILNEKTKRCFSVVPREEFLPESLRNAAYSDRPLPLFRTGQTISAPHMCVMILGYTKLAPSRLKILEVGTGFSSVDKSITNRLRLILAGLSSSLNRS